MTTPELLEFIRIEHALGMSLSEISKLLINEGEWDMADIAEAFRALGLPEEPVERFSEPTVITETPKQAPVSQIENIRQQNISDTSKSQPTAISSLNNNEVIHHAPEPKSVSTPGSIEFAKPVRRAEPMHYVEQPEIKPKPTLAKPASLSGQVSRNLVRTVSTAANYAKIQKPKQAHFEHGGASIHISKLGKEGVSSREAAGPADTKGAALPKPKEVSGAINDIENALSMGIDVHKDEPEPKKVVSIAKKESDLASTESSKIQIADGGEVKFSDSNLGENKKSENINVQNIFEQKVEDKKENVILSQEKKADEKPTTPTLEVVKTENELKQTPEIKPKEEIRSKEEVLAEMQKSGLSEDKKSPVVLDSKKETTTKVEEKIEEKKENIADTPKIEKPLQESPDKETPAKEPEPQPQPQPQTPPPQQMPPGSPAGQQMPPYPYGQYPGMPNMYGGYPYGQMPYGQMPYGQMMPPQYVQAPPQIIIQAPPQAPAQVQYADAPNTPQPKSFLSSTPRTEEIGSVSADLEEQAYLAQFGQAPMPAGIQKPQPQIVTPTIIYTQQVVAPAPSKPEPIKEEPEEKKPEPIRFDIGKLRTAHKTDQSSYSGRPSIISAVNGMEPVGSKSLEDVFKERDINSKTGINTVQEQNKETISSLKVPHKRTMMTDLVNLGEGILPGQVVSQSTKEGERSALAASIIDDEPAPPPPPKKSNKLMLMVSLLVVGILLFGGSAAYYFIAIRIPSSSEIFKSSMNVALRGPAISYEAEISIHGTSTTAEPEYINVEAIATGTLSISPKEFLDGKHYADVDISHIGIPDPITLSYNGSIYTLGDEIFISQNKPTQGAVIENLLKPNELIKIPYQDFGMIMGFVPAGVVSTGEYGSIAQSISLFRMFTANLPIVASGETKKLVNDKKEYYLVPLKIDKKKAVVVGDLLGKYLRGASATQAGAERSTILEERYDQVSGDLVVDKLSMRPIKISFKGEFDPSETSMKGYYNISINFYYPQQIPVVDVKGKTLKELKDLRAEESLSEVVIAKDAPIKTIFPVITQSLDQYAEKFGRYPTKLENLVSSGFIGGSSLPVDINEKVFYSSYVDKPNDDVSGVRCDPKNVKCNFYHLGANLEFRKSSELDTDSDFRTSMINGDDESGCHQEANMACLDKISSLTK